MPSRVGLGPIGLRVLDGDELAQPIVFSKIRLYYPQALFLHERLVVISSQQLQCCSARFVCVLARGEGSSPPSFFKLEVPPPSGFFSGDWPPPVVYKCTRKGSCFLVKN